jgi:hypothetical protein
LDNSPFCANPEANESQGIGIVLIPSDSDGLVINGTNFDDETTIMYKSSDDNAPQAAFLIPLADIEGICRQHIHDKRADLGIHTGKSGLGVRQ